MCCILSLYDCTLGLGAAGWGMGTLACDGAAGVGDAVVVVGVVAVVPMRSDCCVGIAPGAKVC